MKSTQAKCTQNSVVKFTLLELMIVISIISLLLTILLPSLHEARAKAKVTVCKSNMKQVGTSIYMYMANNSLNHPPLFQSGTGDHPCEGMPNTKGSLFPGNAAVYTIDYYENYQTFKDVLFCPLVKVNEELNLGPSYGGSGWKKGDGLWSTSVYLYGKSLKNLDPWKDKRDKNNYTQNLITSINEISEKVIMTDYPQQRATWFPEWKTEYEHYNALMEDGSVKEPARKFTKLNLWLWGITTWL